MNYRLLGNSSLRVNILTSQFLGRYEKELSARAAKHIRIIWKDFLKVLATPAPLNCHFLKY